MNTSVIAAIVIAVAILLFWLIMSYKGFANLRNSSAAAFSDVEIHFKKRRSAVLDLVKLMQKQVPEEAEILQNVKDAIELAGKAEKREERIQCEGALGETIETLLTAAESDPGFSKSKRFQKLRDQIELTERNIANTRKIYNTIVKMMNQRVKAFPSSLIAKMFHFTEQPMI